MKLELNDFTFRYREKGREILSKVTFTADSGSYWCVAGPNGSGKSTLLRAVSGLLSTLYCEGTLCWDGKQVSTWKRLELARSIGFVASGLKTYFPVSVSDFTLQGRYPRSATLWSQPTAADRAAAEQSLERVGIASLSEKSILEISSGELQLAMIARALTQEPRALILDEATANLDFRYQLRIFELLSDLNKQGITIFLVSHDLNLAAEFCPNTLWINDGTVYAKGPTSETLTPQLMADIYGVEGKAEIGRNPFTNRPKIFWK